MCLQSFMPSPTELNINHWGGSYAGLTAPTGLIPVADPEFPKWGGEGNLQGGGTNLLFCQFFFKNCMEILSFWPPMNSHET